MGRGRRGVSVANTSLNRDRHDVRVGTQEPSLIKYAEDADYDNSVAHDSWQKSEVENA